MKKLILVILPFWLIFYILIPPFQIPDEREHYSYVQSLANFHYPIMQADKKVKQISPQTRNLLTIFRAYEIAFNQKTVINKPFDKSKMVTNDQISVSLQAYHPPFYYLVAAVFYKLGKIFLSPTDLYFFTRLASLVFYLVFVLFGYRLLRFFFTEKISFYLSFVAALNPTILMIAIGINPEMAVIALSTVSLYFLVKILKKNRPRIKDWFFLILASSLSFYSKFSGIIIFPTIFFSLIFFLKKEFLVRLKSAIYYFLIQALITVPFFLNNYLHYHKLIVDNFSIVIKHTIPKVITKTMMASYIFFDFRKILLHISGILGWLDAPVFSEIQTLFAFLFVFFLALGIYYYFRTQKVQKNLLAPIWMYIVFTFLFLLTMSVNYKLNHWTAGLQGRYALVAMIPLIVFIFNGLRKFIRMNEEKIAYSLFILNFLYYFLIVCYVLIPRYYV